MKISQTSSKSRPVGILTAVFMACGAVCAFASPPVPKVTPPRKSYYDDRDWVYDDHWKNEEIYQEVNLDDDPQKEVILGFMTTYKPPEDVREEDRRGGMTYFPKEKPIPILEHHFFYQIYKQDNGGHYELIRTVNGMDQPGKVFLLDLGDKPVKAAAFLSPGGDNYTDVSVYRWQQGGWRLLFNTGAIGTARMDVSGQPVKIIFIKPDGSQRTAYAWDRQKEEFLETVPSSGKI